MLNENAIVADYMRNIEGLRLTMLSPNHREVVTSLVAQYDGPKQHEQHAIFIRGDKAMSLLDLFKEFANKDHVLEFGNLVKAETMKKVNDCKDTAQGWMEALRIICMAHPYEIVVSVSYCDSRTKTFIALANGEERIKNFRLVLVR